jgi:acetyltransferase-like isoleucine patch superfamily enzyme
MSLAQFFTKIRRAESPFYAFLYRMSKWIFAAQLPVPRFLSPLFRGMYQLHITVRATFMRLMAFFYWEPLFRARCEKAGKNLVVSLFPYVPSNLQIFVGDNVHLNGRVGVVSGALYKPRLIIHDNVNISHMVTFTINREVVIEEGVLIASHCYIADTDSHPTDPVLRAAGEAPSEDRILAVRIQRNAWIGHASHIMKGVTVGEASIVAAGSVVVKDVPPFSIVAGNPARVVATIPNSSNPDNSTKE